MKAITSMLAARSITGSGWTWTGRAAAEAVRKGGNGPARGVSSGKGGGIRSTTVVPDTGGGSDKSPATPAAKESELSANAAAHTRKN